MLPLRRWGRILQAAMERQPRHLQVSHFPGASSRSAGLRLLLGHCSPGADLDTCGCNPMGAHMDSEVKMQEGAVDEEPHTRAPNPLHCLQLLQGTSEQGPASHGSPHTHTPRPIDTGIFIRIPGWQGWGVTLSQATLGCLHPMVRAGGAILFQLCCWFSFSSLQTYIIST